MSLTLLDIAKRKGVDGFIEEVITRSPELQVLPMLPKNGIDYRVTLRTGLPPGGFRAPNEGAAEGSSTYVQKLVQMYFWDCPLFVDEAIITADDGTAGGLLAQEEIGQVRENMIKIGDQIFNGTGADAGGFAGLFDQVDSTMVVDATGTGTSDHVFMVYANADDDGLKLPFSNRSVLTPKPWREADRVDSDGKRITGMATNLAWWVGLDIGSKYSVGIVKNITTAKPLTDALGWELRSKFPANRKPNYAFMSPAARYMLQKSRSSIGQTKSNARGDAFSDLPESFAGAQIVETDSIGTRTNF